MDGWRVNSNDSIFTFYLPHFRPTGEGEGGGSSRSESQASVWCTCGRDIDALVISTSVVRPAKQFTVMCRAAFKFR